MITILSVLVLSFVYVLITAILYYTKKKAFTIENVYFSILLVATLLLIAMEFVNCAYVTVKLTKMEELIHKSYEITLFIWLTIFFLYGMHMVNEKRDNILTVNSTTIFKIAIIVIYTIAVSTIIYLLPSKVSISYGAPYETGLFIYYFYFIIVFYMLLIDINFFLNKVKEIRKIMSVIAFEVLFTVFATLRSYFMDPVFLVEGVITSIIIIIIVNTIENPDLKIITELDAAKQETEKATRAKDDFLSSMSHEIRTPLNAIVGLSQLISESDNVNEEIKNDVNDIMYASQTLLEIVGNILDINRIESNKMEIQNMNYVPAEMIEELVRVNSVRIGSKNIKLSYNISSDVPYELVGDKVHIKQIINNLLSNAIKFTDEGAVILNVNAINDGFVSNLVITVSDTGKGIKTSDYDKLFNKFERLDTEINSTVNGSGLGLAITKKLVELLNGNIRVNSTLGKGSTFEVNIPQSISMTMNPKQIALEYKIEQMENEQMISRKKKNILLVDDSAINLKIATNFLKGQFINVDTCTSGREAINKVRGNTFDLIFLDLKMPVMDGFKTIDELKKLPGFATPVVAFTAVDEDAEAVCLNAGFKAIFVKPFTKAQFLREINSLIDANLVIDASLEESEKNVKKEQIPTLNSVVTKKEEPVSETTAKPELPEMPALPKIEDKPAIDFDNK